MNNRPPRTHGRVGSSVETAVVVQTLWAEYVWLEQHLQGWTVAKRGEALVGERTCDVLKLESPTGETRDVYFDISGCLKRYQGPPTPPCPYCGAPLVTAKAKQCRRCFADFHDSDHVVYRKGRAHVDRVRSGSVDWKDSEVRPFELADPRAAFTTWLSPKHVTDDIVVLRFPPRLKARDARLFRIGIESLSAQGCRGFICDLDQPMRELQGRSADRSEQIVGLLAFVREIPFQRTVLLRGIANMLSKVVRLENFETEELAVAELTSRLSRSANDAV
jgi:hypothetical protein